MRRSCRSWQRRDGGFSLLELLLLMALLLLLISWGLRISSREVQRQETVRAVHSFLRETAERTETGPLVLLLGNRSGAGELRELVPAERRNGQLALCVDLHLQLPPGLNFVPPAAAAPVNGLGDVLPGHWLAVELLCGSFRLALQFPDGTSCQFFLSDNGTVLREIH